MEKIGITKDQIINKGKDETSRALITFLTEHFTDKVNATIFKQESPSNVKLPAQLNTFCGHKLMGLFNTETSAFEAMSIEEEDISEIMTNKNEIQWINPYNQ